jgi:hypothetical protein
MQLRRIVVALATLLSLSITLIGEARAISPSGTIDLATYFPNAQMSKSFYLKGNDANFRFEDLHGDGTFSAFALVGTQGEGAWDSYALLQGKIVMLAQAWSLEDGSLGVAQYLPDYPALPRLLDLSTLPLRLATIAEFAVRVNGVTTFGKSEVPVTISREGAFIKLHWGDEVSFEILYLGEVPIDGTPFTAPGVARYHTSHVGGIDSTFTWTPRS